MTGQTSTGQTVIASTTLRVVGAPATGTSTNPAETTPGLSVSGPVVTAPPITTLAPTSVSIVNPPVTGQVDQPLMFSAANAVSPNACGTIVGYRWDFGDGTPPINGQTVAHPFTAAGAYNVNLTVTDCSGSTNSASTKVNITAAPPPGPAVSYAGGWNLIGGPTGSVVTGNTGPLYTFGAGDTSYEMLPSGSTLTGGAGYWANFPAATNSTIAMSGPTSVAAQLPAGQFVMIGNPGNAPATVSGADLLLIYSPASNNYTQTTVLQPGQGAWAFSFGGGTATISSGS
jgi:PKD repeat protein